MKNIVLLFAGFISLMDADPEPQVVEWVNTTPELYFVKNPSIQMEAATEYADVTVITDNHLQSIDGFGACFNELGWTTISALNDTDRNAVIRDLFSEEGLNFTYCRMPIGANDFARDWYSFNETDKDFEMKNFGIANDKETLIPFIKSAQKVNLKIRIWASPWSPPTWMKYNKHYACMPDKRVNDLEGEQGKILDGTNMFIQEPEYFEAYALYFRKFIEAYRAEGINIEMVAPQNEFNSCQRFPSCTWTPAGLNTFIGNYLGPQMEEIGVRVMLGTMERKNHLLVDTILQSKSKKYISEVGFQWAGKRAIAEIRKTYPNLKLMQTESECGFGDNSWDYCFYSWNLLKQYFKNGVSAYMYWNISLDKDSLNNRWQWAQNSLISVDQKNKTYQYNPEYYLMKHFSHYIKPGARFLSTEGVNDNILAFSNPDGSIIVITTNKEKDSKSLKIRVGDKVLKVTVKPQSINTFIITGKNT